ncbi:unnamed protein product [Calypogeia fissa]
MKIYTQGWCNVISFKKRVEVGNPDCSDYGCSTYFSLRNSTLDDGVMVIFQVDLMRDGVVYILRRASNSKLRI